MKIFIIYKWDCIIRWVLFGLVVLLALLSSDPIALIDNPTVLSAVTLLSYLFIPIHSVLWLISFIFSIKNKQVPRIVFCVIAPIVSIIFLFFLIIIHVAMTGGVWIFGFTDDILYVIDSCDLQVSGESENTRRFEFS